MHHINIGSQHSPSSYAAVLPHKVHFEQPAKAYHQSYVKADSATDSLQAPSSLRPFNTDV